MNVSTLEAPVRNQPSLPVRPAGDGRERNRTAQNRAAQNRAAQNRAAQNRAGQARTVSPLAPTRPVRRPGRGTGPSARPPRPLDTPVITAPRGAGPRSCAVTAPAPTSVAAPTSWRLTDRAIALVVVTGLVIVTAALAVVGLTAVRVTGERYHVPGSSPAVSAPYTP